MAALTAAACSFVFLLLVLPPLHRFFDLTVYRGAVLWWLHDRPLYAFLRDTTSYGFTYPPFAALTMLPLAFVPSLPC